MLANKDLVSKPAAGRFFPVGIAEALRIMKQLPLHAPPYRHRPDVVLVNSRGPRDHGQPVAALYPEDCVVLYSFPEGLELELAHDFTELALRTLAELGASVHPDRTRPETISFRAYLASPKHLVFTKRSRRAKRAKYRGSDKFTHSGKPKAIQTDERVVRNVDVA